MNNEERAQRRTAAEALRARAVPLWVVPCHQRDAHAFIALHHRHHRPPVSEVLRVAVVDDTGAVRGVATAGRPVARMLDDGRTLEVTRVATDGALNACSLLYTALRNGALALGYTKILTYTLPQEGGASLRAAGWTNDGTRETGAWAHTAGPRANDWPLTAKTRWVYQNPRAFVGDVVWPEVEDDDGQVVMFGGEA